MLQELRRRTLRLSSVKWPLLPHMIGQETVVYGCDAHWALDGQDPVEGRILLSQNFLQFSSYQTSLSALSHNEKEILIPLKEIETLQVNSEGIKIEYCDSMYFFPLNFPSSNIKLIRDLCLVLYENARKEDDPIQDDLQENEGLLMCQVCREIFCSFCQSLPTLKNQCSNGGVHQYVASTRISPLHLCTKPLSPISLSLPASSASSSSPASLTMRPRSPTLQKKTPSSPFFFTHHLNSPSTKKRTLLLHSPMRKKKTDLLDSPDVSKSPLEFQSPLEFPEETRALTCGRSVECVCCEI